MLKPPRLHPGDTVAAISLSWGGPGAVPHRYQAGKRQLEEAFGVRVIETRHALADQDWLDRNPQARADDLMEAFADPGIQGIISTIGGDDSVRLLPHLDIQVIRNNPKVFMGYSDATITHLACFRAGLVSFYGPAIMTGFGENGGLFPYMEQSVRRTLFSAEPAGVVPPCAEGWTVEFLDWNEPSNQSIRRKLEPPVLWRLLQGRGIAEGRLIGGCMEVLEFLKGTEWWPGAEAWDGTLLFLETSEEAPSPEMVKRWLRNYGTQGILEQVNGLLFGRPGGGVAVEDWAKYDEVIRRVVGEEFGRPELPVVTCMDFGHTDPIFVIPYGVRASFDCARMEFAIGESGVEAR